MATDTSAHEGDSSSSDDTVVELRVLSQLSDAPNPLVFPQLPVSTTVADLKSRITEHIPSHPASDHQRLIFQGHVMRDLDPLSTVFSIPAGATGEQRTVHLVVRESQPANPPVFTATPNHPIPAAAVAAVPGLVRVPMGGPFVAPTPQNVFHQAPAVLVPPAGPPMPVPFASHAALNIPNDENGQQRPVHPMQSQIDAVLEQHRRQHLMMQNERMRALGLPTIDLTGLAPGHAPTPTTSNGDRAASPANTGPSITGQPFETTGNTTAPAFPPYVSALFNQMHPSGRGLPIPAPSSQPMQPSQSAPSHRARQVISGSPPWVMPGPGVVSTLAEQSSSTSQPTPTATSTSSDTLVYLLSSPQGPSALVFTPQGTFHGASIQPIPPPFIHPQLELRARLNRQNLYGETAVQQAFQMLRSQQAAMAQPSQPQPAQQQQQHYQHQNGINPPGAVAARNLAGQDHANNPADPNAGDANAPIEAVFAQDRNVFAHVGPLFGHLWLVVRLLGFVWFFSNGHSIKRMLLLGAAAMIFFLVQAGFFRNQLEVARRHFDGLLGAPPAQPLRPVAAAAAAGAGAAGGTGDDGAAPLAVPVPGADAARAQAPSPAGSSTAATRGSSSAASTSSSSTSPSSSASDATLRRRHAARPSTPTPEDTAARLLRDRRARDRGWLMDRVRSVEQGIALFVASLYPGVGEQLVRRAEERARAEERRANEEEVERTRRAILAAAAAAAATSSEGPSSTPPADAVDITATGSAEALAEAGPSGAAPSTPAVDEGAPDDEPRTERTIPDGEATQP